MSPWTFEARAQDQGKFLADLLGTVFHFPELNLQVCQVFRFHHLRCSRLKQISSDYAHGDRRTTIEEQNETDGESGWKFDDSWNALPCMLQGRENAWE